MSHVCPIVVSVNRSLSLEVQLALVVNSLFIVAPTIFWGLWGLVFGLGFVVQYLVSFSFLVNAHQK